MSKKYDWARIRYNLQDNDFFLIRTTYVQKIGQIDLNASLEGLLNEIKLLERSKQLRSFFIEFLTPKKDLEDVLNDYLFDKRQIILSDSVSDTYYSKYSLNLVIVKLKPEKDLIDLHAFHAIFDEFDEFSHSYDFLTVLKTDNVAEFYTNNTTGVDTFKTKLEQLEQFIHEAEKKKSEIKSIEAVTKESQEVIDRAVEVSENIQKLKNLQNSEKEALTDLINEKNQLSKEITEI